MQQQEGETAMVEFYSLYDWRPGPVEAVAFNFDATRLAVARHKGDLFVFRLGELQSTNARENRKRKNGIDCCFGGVYPTRLESCSTGAAEASHRVLLFGTGRSKKDDDEDRLFSLSLNGSVREMCLASGRTLQSSLSGGGAVWAGAVVPNFGGNYMTRGLQLALACDDGSVRFFSVGDEAGDPIEFLSTTTRAGCRLLAICFDASNKRFFVGSEHGFILEYFSSSVQHAGWVPGERMVLKKWKKKNKDKQEDSSSSGCYVWTLCTLPEQHLLISGDSAGGVALWDLRKLTMLTYFNSLHQSDVASVAASVTDGLITIYSAGLDGRLGLIHGTADIYNWSQCPHFFPHARGLSCLAVAANRIATGSHDCSVRVFDSLASRHRAPSKIRVIPAFLVTSDVVHFCKTQEKLVALQTPTRLEIWLAGKLEAKKLVSVRLATKRFLRCSAFANDFSFFAASDGDLTRLFSFDKQGLDVRKRKIPNGILGGASSLSFAGRFLILAATTTTTTKTPRQKQQQKGEDRIDGREENSNSDSGEFFPLKVVDVEKSELVYELPCQHCILKQVISPKGRWLVTVDSTGESRLFETAPLLLLYGQEDEEDTSKNRNEEEQTMLASSSSSSPPHLLSLHATLLPASVTTPSIAAFAFDPCENLVAIVGPSGRFSLFDIKSGSMLEENVHYTSDAAVSLGGVGLQQRTSPLIGAAIVEHGGQLHLILHSTDRIVTVKVKLERVKKRFRTRAPVAEEKIIYREKRNTPPMTAPWWVEAENLEPEAVEAACLITPRSLLNATNKKQLSKNNGAMTSCAAGEIQSQERTIVAVHAPQQGDTSLHPIIRVIQAHKDSEQLKAFGLQVPERKKYGT